MGSAADESFHERLKKLQKAQKSSETVQYTSHGMVVKVKKRRFFPWKLLFGIVLGFLIFKAFLLVNLGEQEYAAKLQGLESGNSVEKAGVYVMGLDPATVWIAGRIHWVKAYF